MNYMKQVAEMLGLELEERVDIVELPGITFALTDKGLSVFNSDGTLSTSHDDRLLGMLLLGRITFKRKPWKPKFHEKFYSVVDDGAIDTDTWVGDFLDMIGYKLGNCYRTREEAEANRDKWAAFYASDEVLEV